VAVVVGISAMYPLHRLARRKAVVRHTASISIDTPSIVRLGAVRPAAVARAVRGSAMLVGSSEFDLMDTETSRPLTGIQARPRIAPKRNIESGGSH